MTDSKASRVYRVAKADKAFVKEAKSIPGNRFPLIADPVDKAVIAAFYCGWLVGRCGTDRAQEIYESI